MRFFGKTNVIFMKSAFKKKNLSEKILTFRPLVWQICAFKKRRVFEQTKKTVYFWKFLNNLSNKNNENNTSNLITYLNEIEIVNKYKLADSLNDYFIDIDPKLKEPQSHNNNAGSNPLLISANMNNIFNFSFSNTNKDEIIYIMKTIKKHIQKIYMH